MTDAFHCSCTGSCIGSKVGGHSGCEDVHVKVAVAYPHKLESWVPQVGKEWEKGK